MSLYIHYRSQVIDLPNRDASVRELDALSKEKLTAIDLFVLIQTNHMPFYVQLLFLFS